MPLENTRTFLPSTFSRTSITPASEISRALSRLIIAPIGDDLAGEGVCHGSCQLKARDAREEGELLVELIAADIGYLIAAAVIEQASSRVSADSTVGGRPDGACGISSRHSSRVVAGVPCRVGRYARPRRRPPLRRSLVVTPTKGSFTQLSQVEGRFSSRHPWP